jgi:hypothetical protein
MLVSSINGFIFIISEPPYQPQEQGFFLFLFLGIKIRAFKHILLYIACTTSKRFKMIPNESLTNMFTRMKTITNNLDALGRTYTNVDIMTKILRSLPKTWETKVMTI